MVSQAVNVVSCVQGFHPSKARVKGRFLSQLHPEVGEGVDPNVQMMTTLARSLEVT